MARCLKALMATGAWQSRAENIKLKAVIPLCLNQTQWKFSFDLLGGYFGAQRSWNPSSEHVVLSPNTFGRLRRGFSNARCSAKAGKYASKGGQPKCCKLPRRATMSQRAGNKSIVNYQGGQGRASMHQRAGDRSAVNYRGGQPCLEERATKVSQIAGAGNHASKSGQRECRKLQGRARAGKYD